MQGGEETPEIAGAGWRDSGGSCSDCPWSLMRSLPEHRGDFRKLNLAGEGEGAHEAYAEVQSLGVGAAVASTPQGRGGACFAGCAWTGTSPGW